MKLEIQKGSENYACQVIKLPPKQNVPGLDKLCKVVYQGNDILTQKDSDEQQLYLFFPVECQITHNYLHFNDEYRDSTLNYHSSQKGYFEQNARVKAIKFKGVISTGYLATVSTLEKLVVDYTKLKEGDEFTDIDGVNICKKYKVVHQHATVGQSKESRFDKKLKRFDKLVQNQFRFHVDTSPLARNLHVFNPDDIIIITDKWHGTSAVFSNLLVNKELSLLERILKKLKVNIVSTKYDQLFSSRSVIKNQYINKEQGLGYYNEDVWGIVNKELVGKIEQGISLYGEIVGYLPSGRMIQKDYDYGCMVYKSVASQNDLIPYPGHKFLCYRITYTKPDGNVIEFSWQQIKNYCAKYNLETVKELYFGRVFESIDVKGNTVKDTTSEYPNWRELLLTQLMETYLEKDCKYCVNKVPAEGIVVRRDGQESYSAYKLKAKRFLEKETKELDKGEVSIEDDGYTEHQYTHEMKI